MNGRLLQTGYTHNPNALHPSGYFADQVIAFLDARAGKQGDGKPFLCWFATPGPHTPLLPSGPADPHDWAHLYHPFEGLGLPPSLEREATTVRLEIQQALMEHITEAEWREVLSYYYGLISQIDYNVGRILERLDQLGLTESTLVVFTADHGEMASEMGCWSKGTGSYDAINRVPLVMRLPGRIAAGKVLEQPTSNVDLMPTILELTGIPVPAEVEARIDGRSLAGLLLDADPGEWPEGAFSEFGSGNNRHRMVRTAVDKYSFDERGRGGRGQEEYYDLVADPFEMNDLIADPAHQARIEHLRGLLAAWWQNGEGQAPAYEVAGEADALPVEAAPRFPRDGAQGAPRDVDLLWLPCTAADRQRVYFGTEPDPPLFRELATMEERCNVGTLAPDTTYYWRVESVNANGSHPGSVASFRTAQGGPGGPGLATGPSPAQRAGGVARPVALVWTPAPDCTAQTLLVGVDAAPSEVASLGARDGRFELDMAPGVRVRWRIDSTNGDGTTHGDEWSFETSPDGLPGWPGRPSPAHLASGVCGDGSGRVVLAWQAAADASQYRVYFGTEAPLELVATVPEARFEVTGLERGRSYRWRVDSVNGAGTRRGWNWRFTP